LPADPSTRKGYALATPLADFCKASPDALLGQLSAQSALRLRSGQTENEQLLAWTESISWLREAAGELVREESRAAQWTLCLEFEIPRRSGRIDAVLVAGDVLFVIEFKSSKATAEALRQAEDYALELCDFHDASHELAIFPVVCASKAKVVDGKLLTATGAAQPSSCPASALGSQLLRIWESRRDVALGPIDAAAWLASPYRPTPTIVEAARSMYAGHSVRELGRSEANADSLSRTQEAVQGVVERARRERNKTICFITGVPGAGKTLAGLNLVYSLRAECPSTFLSGNGPLVRVLQEALAEDIASRKGVSKSEGRRQSSTLITNVHRWLDLYIDKQAKTAPNEDLVIFDEAQRAWSREHSMRKFKRDASEPQMMLEAMGRKEAPVVVALVGNGQEINTGEAGLLEWGKALTEHHTDWSVVASPEVLAGERFAGSALFPHESAIPRDRVTEVADLHLDVPQRSYRSTDVARWVEHVLGNEPDQAALLMEHLQRYPIVLARDLDVARDWLREHSRGLRRRGLLVSSQARRLRSDGIPVSERIDEVNWFLKPDDDVRSSNFLELALTEFGVQGLEVDWSCTAWGGDLTRKGTSWDIRKFKGTKWTQVRDGADRDYALNRYRVLLTRAREGMVIWVPRGSHRDATRDPRRFNELAEYLTACGVRSIA